MFEPSNTSVLLLICFSFSLIEKTDSYCWEPGRNPGFTGPPKVEQIALDLVRVSWEDVAVQRECADQFLVKYWQRSNPQSYLTSELVDTKTNTIDIKVVPKVDYKFQAVAREDKGALGGIDWNKSPVAEFKTSAYNIEIPKTLESPQPTKMSEIHLETGGSNIPLPTEFERPEGGLPLSIEVLAVIALCGVAVVLIFVGLAYKFFCGKKVDMDEESHVEDEEECQTFDSEHH